MKKVQLNEVVKELNLQVIWGNDFLKKEVVKPMSSRPCVEIYAGYFDYFEKDRIQVIGSKELAIFELLKEEDKKERLRELFSYNSPAFVFTKNAEVPKVVVEVAIEKNMPILKSNLSTSALIGNLHAYLSNRLAERVTVNGVMVDVSGVGVLIRGVDGIGKSETALELVKRGHLLVSDDDTRVYQREPGMVIVESSKVKEKLMEIKDIGVVNVVNLFGIGSYRPSKRLMMVVDLVRSEDEVSNEPTVKFFDTEVAHTSIIVESGRNIATLIETAALNYQLVNGGKDANAELKSRIMNYNMSRGK
ncbi:MAG: HPr(Ser) kinase/phosphatase [Bacilli bacterium]